MKWYRDRLEYIGRVPVEKVVSAATTTHQGVLSEYIKRSTNPTTI